MKKLVLIALAILVGVAVNAQPMKVSNSLVNKSVKAVYNAPADILPIGSKAADIPAREVKVAINETYIGTTYYDVQTNSSLSNRFVKHPDGTMGATWTRGLEPTSYPDRGTGYNFFDGSNWGPAPTARIESVRCGWPSYATWGPTGEIVISHTGGTSGLKINKREVRGTGAWTESALPGPTGLTDVTWPRVITTGENNDIIHLVVANDASLSITGQASSMFYSRSTDGGETWDPNMEIMEGTGIEYYSEISADEYTWAVRGNTLVLLVADAWKDMFILKSTDNGENWEKTVIWQHPYPFFEWTSTVTDTFFCVNSSADVAIGPDGKVHVAFGINRVLHADTTTTYNYFPYVDGIGYWEEGMPMFNADGDNLNALAGPQYGYETSEMIENYNYIGWTQDVDGDGTITFLDNLMSYQQHGLSTQPTIIVDDAGRVFVGWASTTETYQNADYNYKKIWARAYENGTWGPFLNVTEDIIHLFDESIYPQLVDGGDNTVYLMYQADGLPGLAATTTPDHEADENNIIVAAIDKTDLLTGLGKENQLLNESSVSQNYPNPFNGTTTITVNLEKSANLSMVVTNMVGQQVQSFNRGQVSTGTYYFEVNGTNLPKGVYFYTVKADDSTITKKMIVR